MEKRVGTDSDAELYGKRLERLLRSRKPGRDDRVVRVELFEVLVEVRRRDADTRPESFSPTEDSIKVVQHLDGWTQYGDTVVYGVRVTTVLDTPST